MLKFFTFTSRFFITLHNDHHKSGNLSPGNHSHHPLISSFRNKILIFFAVKFLSPNNIWHDQIKQCPENNQIVKRRAEAIFLYDIARNIVDIGGWECWGLRFFITKFFKTLSRRLRHKVNMRNNFHRKMIHMTPMVEFVYEFLFDTIEKKLLSYL